LLRAFAIAAALGAATVAGQPARGAETLVYDIRAEGFRFGELSVAYEPGAGEYSVEVTAAARGLFGLLTRARYDGRSSGLLRGGRPVPALFSARSRRIFRSRVAEVRFLEGVPVAVTMRPERDRTPMSDPARVEAPVIDPLSYLGQVTGRPTASCPPPQALYDGRRQTGIAFAPAVAAAGGFSCSGSYEIVNGPSHSLQPKERRFGLRLTYAPLPEGGFRLTRILFLSGGSTVRLDLLPGPGG